MPFHHSSHSRRVLGILLGGLGLAGGVSLGTWALNAPHGVPVYLLYLPLCLGLPYALLAAPLALLSASDRRAYAYSWGASVLAVSLAAAWCIAAVVDPTASSPTTHQSIFFGWMAGGTTYEVLLLLLVAGS